MHTCFFNECFVANLYQVPWISTYAHPASWSFLRLHQVVSDTIQFCDFNQCFFFGSGLLTNNALVLVKLK